MHPCVNSGVQTEMLWLLRRICEHFISSISLFVTSSGFDAVKIVVLGTMSAIAGCVVRTCVRCISSEEAKERLSERSQFMSGLPLYLHEDDSCGSAAALAQGRPLYLHEDDPPFAVQQRA